MDFRQLEYVVALADLRVLAKASERVFVTVSALSQSIAKLEEEIGTPLFNRTKGGWTLTHAGRIYVEAGREILRMKKRVMGEIGDIIDGQKGSLSIGFSPGRSLALFREVFPQFNATYPNVKLNLREMYARELEDMVAKGELDMAFTTTVLDHPGLEYEVLKHEDFVLAMPRTPKYRNMIETFTGGETNRIKTVDIRLLRDEEFLIMSPVTTMRVVTDIIFEKAGFMPKAFFEINSISTMYSLIEGGHGMSIIPRRDELSTKNVALFRTDPPGGWDIAVASLKGSYASSAQKYFISLARHYYAAVHPSK